MSSLFLTITLNFNNKIDSVTLLFFEYIRLPLIYVKIVKNEKYKPENNEIKLFTFIAFTYLFMYCTRK